MILEIQLLTWIISFSLKPLVVIAGVPILIPDVTNGEAGSFGTAFLFTVMFTDPRSFSRSFPVIPFFEDQPRQYDFQFHY